MTASKTPAQELRDILDGDQRQHFDESGCSDHVRRRNLRASVAVAALLLFVLIVLIIS